MTLRSSDLQSDSDLDSIRNSCDVFFIGHCPHIFGLEPFHINLGVGILLKIFLKKGLEAAKITLCASTCSLSSQTRVTSSMDRFTENLERYIWNNAFLSKQNVFSRKFSESRLLSVGISASSLTGCLISFTTALLFFVALFIFRLLCHILYGCTSQQLSTNRKVWELRPTLSLMGLNVTSLLDWMRTIGKVVDFKTPCKIEFT